MGAEQTDPTAANTPQADQAPQTQNGETSPQQQQQATPDQQQMADPTPEVAKAGESSGNL